MLSRKTLKKTRVAKFAQKALTHKQMIVKASPKLDYYEREEAKYAAAYLKTLEKLTEHLLVFEDCIADFDPHDADRGKIGKYIDMLDRSIIALTDKMENKLIALTSRTAAKSKTGKAIVLPIWKI